MKAPSSLALVALAAGLGVLTRPAHVCAKEYGIHSPNGRDIYDLDETFANLANTRRRRFVVEAAVGAGPEGNVAALVGWLNPLPHFSLYGGFGLELNPARHYTIAVRYDLNLRGYRPYASLGYLFNDLYRLGTFTHEVFAEIGYVWVIHETYRLTLGVGTRYRTYLGIRTDSILRSEAVDPALLSEQRSDVFPFVPTLALRFSRAF